MNRYERRLQERNSRKGLPKELTQALATLGSLQEFSKLSEQLKPYLEKIELLATKLENIDEVLQEAEKENTALRTLLEEQRQTFLRMLAVGMGIPLKDVLLIESQAQSEWKNADTPTTQAAREITETNQSPNSP